MLTLRLATPFDVHGIKNLMHLAISELQKEFLSEAQIAASFGAMGLDTQLIEDKTYFCVEEGGVLMGCGGWSRRATLYGGNHTEGRDASALNPSIHRAKIRAMYTHPEHIRRGIGTLIIDAAENAAQREGFTAFEMAATLAGVPFYMKLGYHIESEWNDTDGPVSVPLRTMVKNLY